MKTPAIGTSALRMALALAAVFGLATSIYWRSLYGQPIWDDHALIDQSQVGGHTVWQVLTGHVLLLYYRPLTGLSYFIDSKLFGMDPMGFHATSILIHALASIAVAWSAFKIFSSGMAGLVAGIGFAAQPAQVAATAWIGGRTDDLSCLFVAIFTACLFEHLERPQTVFLALSVCSFLCALLTKEQNLALLPLVPLAGYVTGIRNWKGAVMMTAPFVVAAGGFLALFLIFGSNVMRTGSLPIGHELQRVGDSAIHYSRLLLLPDAQTLNAFSLKAYGSVTTMSMGLALVVSLVAASCFAIRANPRLGFVLWGAILAYLPVSNLVPAPSMIVAPYRVAVTGVFIALLISYALVEGCRSKQYLLAGLAATSLAIGTYWTIVGVGFWLDEAAFFKLDAGESHQIRSSATAYNAQAPQGHWVGSDRTRHVTG